jgi:hypothetical protein
MPKKLDITLNGFMPMLSPLLIVKPTRITGKVNIGLIWGRKF